MFFCDAELLDFICASDVSRGLTLGESHFSNYFEQKDGAMTTIFIKLNLDQQIKDRAYLIAFFQNKLQGKVLSIFPDNVPSYWHAAGSLARGGLASIMRPFARNSNCEFKSPLDEACGIPTVFNLESMEDLSPKRLETCLSREIDNAFDIIAQRIENVKSQDKSFEYILVPYKDGKPAFGGGTAEPLPGSCLDKIIESLGRIEEECGEVVELSVSGMASCQLFSSQDAEVPQQFSYTRMQLWLANLTALSELACYLDWFTGEGVRQLNSSILPMIYQQIAMRFQPLEMALPTVPCLPDPHREKLEGLIRYVNKTFFKLYQGKPGKNWDGLIKPLFIQQRQQLVARPPERSEPHSMADLWGRGKKRPAHAQSVDGSEAASEEPKKRERHAVV